VDELRALTHKLLWHAIEASVDIHRLLHKSTTPTMIIAVIASLHTNAVNDL
jgi:hypothetical protein